MRGGFGIKRVAVAGEWGFLRFGIGGLLVAITICFSCCNAQTLLHHNDNYNNNTNTNANNASSPDASVCANAIAVYGYQCQEYLVTTGDGYILSVQRIPHGRLGRRRRRDPPSPTKNRPPVLFQHGLLLDGRSWFYNKAEANLPMILADKGYDVWISNTRGTEYSRRHQYLDPNAREFWYWTWDHLAKYDLPVLIDLVFKTTGQKVHFVGHALGSLLCLAALAEGNVGVDKVRSAALLSPTVYASHMTSILVKAAVKLHIAELGALIGIYEFNLNSDPVSRLVRMLCSQPSVSCYNLPTPLTGKNCCINSAAIRHFAESGMQSTSIRNLKHLSQNVRHGTLEKYDYGNAEVNMQHYGRRKPPLYDLSRIPKNLPVFISYGGADQMADTADVKVLLGELKPALNTDMLRVQYVPNYAHYDFIMGLNANHLVYTQLIAFLDPLK